MRDILIYLVQVTIASGILYGYYHWVLRNREFHQYNRFYLLAATVVSLLIPFLQIPVYFSNPEATSAQMLRGLQVIYWDQEGDALTVYANQGFRSWGWQQWSTLLYSIVGGLLVIRFFVSLYKIHRLVKSHTVQQLEGIHFINTEAPGTPFTFFRWLFWDRRIDLSSNGGQQIFRHEWYHIEQKHSWDVVFMEIVRTLLWINPFFHLMRRELKAIHEFLADRFAANEQDKWSYAEFLLMQALQTNNRLVNPFFHSQIKRRIAMITNSQKTSHRYLRKVLALPIAALVLGLLAFKVKNSGVDIVADGPAMTVVLDPGHGGFDPGARSNSANITEDRLAYAIAEKMIKLAPGYRIDLVLTRERNEAAGGSNNKSDDLKARLTTMQNADADALVSLHVNTAPSSSKSGIEAYIRSKNQKLADRHLASNMLQSLSSVYQTANEIRMRKSSGIYLLDNSTVPSALLELGYISNSTDLSFLMDEKNQEALAHQILKGLRNYRNSMASLEDNIVAENIVHVVDTVPAGTVKEDIIEEKSVKLGTMLKIRPAGSEQPMFVIDGKVVNADNKSTTLDSLNPNRINRVTVLKDASATQLYGEAAKNGVVVIETKPIEKLTLNEVVVEGYPTNRSNQPQKVILRGNATLSSVKPTEQEVLVENRFPAYTVVADSITVVGKPASLSVRGQAVEIKEVRLEDLKKVAAGSATIRPDKNDEMDEVVVVGYSRTDKKQEPLFVEVEESARPEGGEAAWRKHLERNLDVNVAVRNDAPLGKYTVKVRFLVKKDGSISNLTPITQHGYGMEDEAVKTIHNGPKWLPAKQNGKAVNSYRVQPITFVVLKDENEKPTSLQLAPVKEPETGINGVLYPNPSSSNAILQIQSEREEVITARIMTADGQFTGQQHKQILKPGRNIIRLDIASLKAGIYFVNMVGDKGQKQTYKLVKK